MNLAGLSKGQQRTICWGGNWWKGDTHVGNASAWQFVGRENTVIAIKSSLIKEILGIRITTRQNRTLFTRSRQVSLASSAPLAGLFYSDCFSLTNLVIVKPLPSMSDLCHWLSNYFNTHTVRIVPSRERILLRARLRWTKLKGRSIFLGCPWGAYSRGTSYCCFCVCATRH